MTSRRSMRWEEWPKRRSANTTQNSQSKRHLTADLEHGQTLSQASTSMCTACQGWIRGKQEEPCRTTWPQSDPHGSGQALLWRSQFLDLDVGWAMESGTRAMSTGDNGRETRSGGSPGRMSRADRAVQKTAKPSRLQGHYTNEERPPEEGDEEEEETLQKRVTIAPRVEEEEYSPSLGPDPPEEETQEEATAEQARRRSVVEPEQELVPPSTALTVVSTEEELPPVDSLVPTQAQMQDERSREIIQQSWEQAQRLDGLRVPPGQPIRWRPIRADQNLITQEDEEEVAAKELQEGSGSLSKGLGRIQRRISCK